MICQKYKYPFIGKFVDAMEIINAPEYVTSSETDLKSLLIFFKLYVSMCRKLKSNGFELSKANIQSAMDQEFDFLSKNGGLQSLQSIPQLKITYDSMKGRAI